MLRAHYCPLNLGQEEDGSRGMMLSDGTRRPNKSYIVYESMITNESLL